MHRVLAVVREAREKLASHAFFEWLDSAPVPLIDKLAFSPVLADFIMGFADLNKWFIKYPQPSDALQEALNEHASEDQTHSRLFVDEWTKLGLDEMGWSASDTLWWWFWCSETEVIRRAAMETLSLAERNQDPLVRFGMVEAIETCGDVFFSRTCPIAVALEQETGIRFDYYGVYHREREDGHLRCDERAFTDAALEPWQLERALAAAGRIFALFEQELDQLLDYSLRITQDREAVAATLRVERASQRVDGWVHGPTKVADFIATRREPVPNMALRVVTQQLDARVAQLQQHRFIRWLADPQQWDDGSAAVEALRGFVPLWAIDVLGYKDFNQYVLRFAEPRSAEERAINRWTERLASHGALYLQDWQALGIDRDLGWGARETIEHYFLGAHSEVHRYAMARVKKRAFVSDSARLRYWLMRALEEGGQVLFDTLRPLALAAEGRLEAELSYWAGRHYLAHPEQPEDEEADRVSFTALALDDDERLSALETIDVVFDNLEQLFELSMRVVEERLGMARAGYAHEPVSRASAI